MNDYDVLVNEDARGSPLNGRIARRTREALVAIWRAIDSHGDIRSPLREKDGRFRGSVHVVRVLDVVPRWQLEFLRQRGLVTLRGRSWLPGESVRLTAQGGKALVGKAREAAER